MLISCVFLSPVPNLPLFALSVSTEARPPALHMDRQVQGRLTPCWAHLLRDLGCMLWQFGTYLLTCPPHTCTHHHSFMSVSLRSTVVSSMTYWTTGKGMWLCFVVLQQLKNIILTIWRILFWIESIWPDLIDNLKPPFARFTLYLFIHWSLP